MASLLQTLWRALRGRTPRLVCDTRTWNAGVDELRRRSAGRRESGAFLLGENAGDIRCVHQFLFYDDVDPTCFANGIVEFDGAKFGKVWECCRTHGFTVVADVHVHPRHYGQSSSDRQNPMIAETGHFALIIPDYATRKCMPGAIGIYEYSGDRQWHDHSRGGERVFHVGWWPK